MIILGVQNQVSKERRLELLRALPSFDGLEADVLNGISENLGEEKFEPGDVIMHESQFGDRMYLVESGVVGVSTDGPGGAVQLGKLGVGDRFGEVSLLSSTRRRRATVTALTPVVTLTLGMRDYQSLAATHPEVRMDLACAAGAFMQARLEALMAAQRQRLSSIAKTPLSF